MSERKRLIEYHNETPFESYGVAVEKLRSLELKDGEKALATYTDSETSKNVTLIGVSVGGGI